MTYQIMIDAMGINAVGIPVSTPVVAGYVTGSGDVPWTQQDWDRFPGGHVRIDQSPGLVSWTAGDADVADMEQQAGTQHQVIAGALARKARGWMSWVYVSRGALAALRGAVLAAQLTGHVQYWVADWSLDEAQAAAQLTGDVVAIQWASPSSDPHTVVPGGTQTLSQAGADLSVTVPGWFAKQVPAREGVLIAAQGPQQVIRVTSADGKTWLAA